jgi:hypothetical protein
MTSQRISELEQSCCLSILDTRATSGEGGEFGAVRQAELGEDVADVALTVLRAMNIALTPEPWEFGGVFE